MRYRFRSLSLVVPSVFAAILALPVPSARAELFLLPRLPTASPNTGTSSAPPNNRPTVEPPAPTQTQSDSSLPTNNPQPGLPGEGGPPPDEGGPPPNEGGPPPDEGSPPPEEGSPPPSSVVPTPPALVLGLLGFGLSGLYSWRRRHRPQLP